MRDFETALTVVDLYVRGLLGTSKSSRLLLRWACDTLIAGLS